MLSVCISFIAGAVAGGIVARIMIGNFLKKVESIDENFREEVVGVVIQTVKENAFKPRLECMRNEEL